MLSPRFRRAQSLGLVFVLLSFNTFGLRAESPACRDLPLQSGLAPIASEESPDAGLKVVSLNMARNTRAEEILVGIRGSRRFDDADVWLLQEAADSAPSSGDTVKTVASALGLHHVFAPADVLDNGKLLSGLGIMSRYPIEHARPIRLLQHNLKFNTRCRIALEATVRGPAGPIRFYNVHLDTRINNGQRLEQIRPVLESSASWQGPTVIGGDFNTVNVRWLWNLLPLPFAQNHSNSLRETLRRNGFESPLDDAGGTLNVLGLSFRLDWIFPKGLKPLDAGVQDIDFSDHDAPWVELSWPADPSAAHEEF